MQWLKDFTATAKTKMAQYNNANFKSATMAVCALVAAADGQIEPEEKSKVAALIGKNELLAAFDPVALRDMFLGFCDAAVDEFARLDLLSHVKKIKANSDQAEMAVRIAIIIANADGEFEDSEKKVVTEICGVLGLPAASFLI